MTDVSTCKFVLLGNGSVGKTSIIARFLSDGFTKMYKQTVGCDFVEKTLELRGKPCKVSVWDIGGQSLSSDNLPNYVCGSDAIFFCYDVTDDSSFRDLDDWVAKVNAIYDDMERRAKEEAENEMREKIREKAEKGGTLGARGSKVRTKSPKVSLATTTSSDMQFNKARKECPPNYNHLVRAYKYR